MDINSLGRGTKSYCKRLQYEQSGRRCLVSVVVRGSACADGGGGVQDGHGEKVRESLRPVHYDYKNRLGGMMRKFCWVLLSFLLFIACDNSNLTKEQEEINHLSQELEGMKAQLEEVTSQVDKTNQELEQGEVNQLSQELESVKNQLEEVISQVDKTNQELNQIDIKLNADVRVEPKPVDNAEDANELKPQIVNNQEEKPNPLDPKPQDELKPELAPEPIPLDLTDMVLIPTTFQEISEPAVFDEFGDLVKPKRKVKKVHVPSFYIDKYEVTVGQFRKFLKESGYKSKFRINWNTLFEVSPTESHPMLIFTWDDALAYANWVGKRLPTADEWMHAAYGRETTNCADLYQSWPWGGKAPEMGKIMKGEGRLKAIQIARDHANFAGAGGRDKWEMTTAPVGSFKPNKFGIHDMAGNLSEFTLPGDHGRLRTFRGGSYKAGVESLQVRFNPDKGSVLHSADALGLRCVADVK